MAVDSIADDAISFIRCIVLWSEKWGVPKQGAGSSRSEVPTSGRSGSSWIWNSQIRYKPIYKYTLPTEWRTLNARYDIWCLRFCCDDGMSLLRFLLCDIIGSASFGRFFVTSTPLSTSSRCTLITFTSPFGPRLPNAFWNCTHNTSNQYDDDDYDF